MTFEKLKCAVGAHNWIPHGAFGKGYRYCDHTDCRLKQKRVMDTKTNTLKWEEYK